MLRGAVARRHIFIWVTLAVFLAFCGSPDPGTATVLPPSLASISANPNPVPTGTGLGTTTVTWNAPDSRNARVLVSVDGGEEALFAAGSVGNTAAPWIADGSRYVFRLYHGESRASNLLGEVSVSRGAPGSRPVESPVRSETGARAGPLLV